MRVLHLGNVIRGRSLTSNHVSFPKRTITAFRISMTSTRHHSSIPEPVKVTPWSQHTLKSSGSFKNEPSPAPSIKQNEKHRAYIALGSNLGDRIGWIEKACNEMSARGVRITRTSNLWETEPMYVLNQEQFINGACEVETGLDPLTLLNELQSIENALGRQKVVDKGPRNIDLDVLLYDDQVVDHERLKIPHPGMFEREFVLRPLAELVPGKTLDQTSPWKVTQDYLNALPSSQTPLSTLTPLSPSTLPLRALQPNRQTHVMAILNLTPDSFSDGGKHSKDSNMASLLATMDSFISSGASSIDVGGQSSAPYAKDVSSEEEISRICPAIELLRQHNRKVTVSVDTYRADVAEAAVLAGADIINDISAGQLDPNMLSTMARLGKTVCLMHMRGTPATMNKLTNYEPEGLIPIIAKELLERVAAAEAAGVRRWRIILDPGIGFAKTSAQNLEILRRLDELRDWPGLRGLPWLLGSSRKNFVGKITGVEKPEERTWGTAATVAAGVQCGADIVRVHDVKEMAQVAKMSDAIWRV